MRTNRSTRSNHNRAGLGDADDRIIYDQANDVLYYDADGTGAAGQIEFVNVTAGTTITSDDFQIF